MNEPKIVAWWHLETINKAGANYYDTVSWRYFLRNELNQFAWSDSNTEAKKGAYKEPWYEYPFSPDTASHPKVYAEIWSGTIPPDWSITRNNSTDTLTRFGRLEIE